METIRACNTRYDSKVSPWDWVHMSRESGDISEISAVIVTSEQKLTAGMLAMLSPSYLIPLFTQTFTILILCLMSGELIWRNCSRTNCPNANSNVLRGRLIKHQAKYVEVDCKKTVEGVRMFMVFPDWNGFEIQSSSISVCDSNRSNG